jgi:aspartyl-tRNA synthetase
MTGAPGGVASKQLDELHVASTWVDEDESQNKTGHLAP